jgi:hypothetical protein
VLPFVFVFIIGSLVIDLMFDLHIIHKNWSPKIKTCMISPIMEILPIGKIATAIQ